MSWSWEVESLKHTEKCACIIKVRCAKNSMITWSIYKHGIDTVYVYVWIFITTYIRLILRRIIKQINIKKKKRVSVVLLSEVPVCHSIFPNFTVFRFFISVMGATEASPFSCPPLPPTTHSQPASATFLSACFHSSSQFGEQMQKDSSKRPICGNGVDGLSQRLVWLAHGLAYNYVSVWWIQSHEFACCLWQECFQFTVCLV